MDMEKYLSGHEKVKRVNNGFSVRSNGDLKGTIGAIDGWLVKIITLSWKLNKLTNRGTFFQGRVSMPIMFNVWWIIIRRCYGLLTIIEARLMIHQSSEIQSCMDY